MNAAVFLDRDNTIIHNDGDLGDPTKVRLIQGAASAVASLKGLGYRIIVVSNQGGVARGKFTEADVEAVNHRINELIYANSGVAVDRFYYCPYHPEGTEDRYRREHPWRKPRPGMLFQAAKDFGLDLTQSWIIGDQMRDVQAGFTARAIPILLLERGEPPGPTAAIPPAAAEDRHAGATVMIEPALDYFVVRNLVEAVRLIGQKARPSHVAAAMKANRTEVVPKAQPRVSTSTFDPNMVSALTGGGATPAADAASTPASASVDEGSRNNRTDATAEKKEAATMKPGVSDIERSDGSSHDALPEQAVEARGQIEELIAAAGEARRNAARPPSPPTRPHPGDEPDLFGADPPPRSDGSRNAVANREAAQLKAPAPRSSIALGQEDDQNVGLRDRDEGEAEPSRGAAGPLEAAPDSDIPRPPAEGKAAGAAAVKRRQRGAARAEEARPDAATPPPRSASGRREAAATSSPSDRPAPSAPRDDDPAQPSAEHTLRQILQELRNQRVVSGDFSWTTVLALVLQMMTVVCVAAALLMGGGNGDLFMRWMACAIVLQLATLTMMLVRR